MSQAITAVEIAQMKAAAARVRGTSITIRRGATTLAAQTVHIARANAYAANRDTPGAEQAAGKVIVLGSSDFDVAKGDRFTNGGQLYEVSFVRPDNGGYIEAEAEAVQ